MGIFRRKKKEEPEPPKNELEKDIIEAAAEAVAHFEGSDRATLDYSIESFETVDGLLDEASDFTDDMDPGQVDWIVQNLGSYVFEVARKAHGGKYYWNPSRSQPILVVGEPEFRISMLAFDKVKGRLENGSEDNIPFYYAGFADHIRQAKPGDEKLIV